jgi:hypothetical protein
MFRKCFDRRALTPVISSIIMASVVIALSFGVLVWSQFRTSNYAENYGETTDAEIARLKERLTVEYISHNGSSGNIRIYLLNCGAIDNVTIHNVHVNNASWHEDFPSPSLIPDQALDRGEEGYLILHCGNLAAGTYYFVNILTERRSLFETGFVA